MSTEDGPPSNKTVFILLFLLVALIVLLIVLYKKLNKEADGEYTVRRMVYKEGGVRDRMRGAAMALESRLGVQLWPRSGNDEDGEEMRDIRDEEGEVEGGSSQGSDSEGDDQEREEEEEEDAEQSERGGTSDDNSSLASSEAGEQTRLQEPPKGKGETGVGEEEEEKAGDGEGQGEASERAGLSLNLNQMSGSAIWFEEGGKGSDVTAL